MVVYTWDILKGKSIHIYDNSRILVMIIIIIVFLIPLVFGHYHYQSGYYFKQSHDSTDENEYNILNDIGNVTSFDKIVANLSNNTKLLYLQRHGEGYHNIVPDLYSHHEWNCYLQMQDGDDKYVWYDANLTDTGIKQIQKINQMWKNTAAPIPQSFYVSPLIRTLETWKLNWHGITDKFPIVKELARETYGISTSSKRHDKKFIASHYLVEFETDFTENDELWEPTVHEGKHHRNYRAKKLLDEIFNDENSIISLVSHSGLIESLLKVIGHRKFKLAPGQMIPVVVTRTENDTKNKYDNQVQDWSGISQECKRKDELEIMY